MHTIRTSNIKRRLFNDIFFLFERKLKKIIRAKDTKIPRTADEELLSNATIRNKTVYNKYLILKPDFSLYRYFPKSGAQKRESIDGSKKVPEILAP